ncbi:RipA family octameric membrane protein [Mogibacterium timidum]|uniref:RipA family octameric membrane protein n=1 Tax=Mogibacterium timidum TaxID=35519 RepID=UPI003AB99A8E
MLVAGIVVCVLWILFIKNYKQLNAVKFEIINKMENGLPYQAFNEEWEKLKSSKRYMDGTKLEKFLPIMFIILYFVTAIIILIIKLKTGRTT